MSPRITIPGAQNKCRGIIVSDLATDRQRKITVITSIHVVMLANEWTETECRLDVLSATKLVFHTAMSWKHARKIFG